MKKSMTSRRMPQITQKLEENNTKQLQILCYPTSHVDVQPKAKTVPDVAKPIILSECAGVRAEDCQKIATEANREQLLSKLRLHHNSLI